ncbi:hypothetical protein MTX26_30505 [Bradyrhizobium sp. ISRA443]|uniref:hypothetical protein n=1 Tax=unclassified Bradyrhizobium TaxID=2631580 RepID=UPI002479AC7B|nr:MULTISPECIES: hypothetical protein [unclassified Bradyrhizobium]WGR93895.1 hypothetical protein MTX20_05490 [Bradyrhizobium sp. ISRA435]WGR98515.1 hypothetical protein MTX23_30490 [Bradyrhizobium sp. ISRA436]WGS05404.1 hypothetical protein MTX18_30510 [Bradyrhizobium sp. ISRA437]WGS12290.1 hypothetical protein MTX26_30505 [Bradyrhizobium sp. ISRA443]
MQVGNVNPAGVDPTRRKSHPAHGSANDNSRPWSPPSPAPRLSCDIEQDEQLISAHYPLEREHVVVRPNPLVATLPKARASSSKADKPTKEMQRRAFVELLRANVARAMRLERQPWFTRREAAPWISVTAHGSPFGISRKIFPDIPQNPYASMS